MKKSYPIILVLLAAGCVYYNTFFNAEKYFSEAQAMPLRDNGRPSAGAIQNYNNAIKKCGIVLTDYKDSKYADDALFLMAKCFYYIGRNYTQAIKHFDELLEFYPESEFVLEARIYLAKCYYEMGKKKEAFDRLQQFLSEPVFFEKHPIALRQLADYHLADKNFVEADFYLNRLIEKHPTSEYYDDAFFLMGKAQHEAHNYEASNEVFHALLKSKVTRNMKLDARYYVTLNHIMQNQNETALKSAISILKDEYREENISKIQLLKARALMNVGKIEDAIDLFKAIIEDNKRTALSAEASFFLGEIYFNKLRNYEKAIEYYGNVRKEFAQSEYISEAVSRSAVASQIIQFNNPDTSLSIEELVNQQFKLAEFYLDVLNLPDSALFVYDFVINQQNDLLSRLDSLYQQIQKIQIKHDSMAMLAEISLSDSIMAEADSLFSVSMTDSFYIEESLSDSLISADLDSIEKTNWQDSLLLVQAELKTLQTHLSRQENDLSRYKEEFIPYAQFVKIWILKNVIQDSLKASEIFADLQKTAPENRYTYAAARLLSGESVHLTTETELQHKKAFEESLELIFTDPDSAAILLNQIAADSTHTHYLNALYSLAFLNHYVYQDTLQAEALYDSVLSLDKEDLFKPHINKFYQSDKILKLERLPYLIQLEETERLAKEQEKEKKSSLEQKELPEDDSISYPDRTQKDSLPDSLLSEPQIDSLIFSADSSEIKIENSPEDSLLEYYSPHFIDLE